jgi:hypothetical protein
MFNRYMTAQAAGQNASPPSNIFQPPERQRVVQDVVKLAPVRDPYAELSKASDRLSAGRSVFESGFKNELAKVD